MVADAGEAHGYTMLRHLESQPATTEPRPSSRDPLIDFLRAASLLVVVAWHWLFTVVIWHNGPHTSNPIGTTPGMWALTWVLQVMPLFFFVGGFAHLVTWESVERDGRGYGEFLRRRLSRLLRPTAVCLAVMLVARILLSVITPGVAWVGSGMMLVLSPLWFLGIYVGLVVVTPLAVRLHRATGIAGLVVLAAAAVVVDMLRFDAHIPGIAMANLAIVWAFCHQLGFHWRTLITASRRTAWALALTGFAGLVALTNIGVYPRSMVGVPGEAISNMGPPTMCILALMLLQVGVVLLVRERMTEWLGRPRPKRFTMWAGSRSMTVYLWHFPAFAAAYGLFVAFGHHVPDHTSLAWWVERPLWAVVPAAIVTPVVVGLRRFEVHR